MADGRAPAIEALLLQTEAAHGEYETAELNGVYDQDWARWYAAHAVEHGIGGLLGREVSAEELGTFLAAAFASYERDDPHRVTSWASSIAERLVAQLPATDPDS
jgi:hypothetical protein